MTVFVTLQFTSEDSRLSPFIISMDGLFLWGDKMIKKFKSPFHATYTKKKADKMCEEFDKNHGLGKHEFLGVEGFHDYITTKTM